MKENRNKCLGRINTSSRSDYFWEGGLDLTTFVTFIYLLHFFLKPAAKYMGIFYVIMYTFFEIFHYNVPLK